MVADDKLVDAAEAGSPGALSFRRRATLEGEARQFARTWTSDGLWVGALSSASECGFSVHFAAGSESVLDVAQLAWEKACGAPPDRLEALARTVEQTCPAALATLVPAGYDEVGGPYAELVVALVEGSRAWIAWIGTDEALLLRDHRVIEASCAHTLHRRERERLPGEVLAGLPDVSIRALGVEMPNAHLEALPTPWDLLPGDRLVVRSASSRRRTTPAELERLSHGHPDDAGLADAIVEQAMERDAASAAAIVLTTKGWAAAGDSRSAS